jgi:ubiquinol-cytochrome c reductase cytochrome c subunit
MSARAAKSFILGIMAGALLLVASPLAGAQAAPSASKPAGSASGDAKNGKRIYTSYGCYECHGREAQGSVLTGPRIGPHPAQFSTFVRYIRQPKGEMPPYTQKIVSDAELADIYSFLQSLPQPPDPRSIPLLNSAPGREKGR